MSKVIVKKGRVIRSISRVKALELIQGSKGRFFTVRFIKKNGSLRIMNAQYAGDTNLAKLGYVLVKDTNLCRKSPGNCTRNINLQTLKSLVIDGKAYRIS